MDKSLAPQLVWIISGIGLATLTGVFWRMKKGFGPMNLRAVGIVLVATFASLLSAANPNSLSAGMGILGGIAGYLFGTRDEKSKKSSSDEENQEKENPTA